MIYGREQRDPLYSTQSKLKESIHRLGELFSVLGNAIRLKILFQLDGTEKSVSEIAESMDRSQGSISKHLKVMRYEDLVEAKTEGKHRLYTIKRPEILKLCRKFVTVLQRDTDI